MDLRSGYPYFLLKNGYLFSYPSLSEDIKAEVVVIGAGISGALAAYYLINSGVDVALVDKRHPGLGSTCASTAILQYELDVGLADLSKKTGPAPATASYLLCVDAIYKLRQIAQHLAIDSEFGIKPSLYLASGKTDVKALQEEYEARNSLGIVVNYLTPKEIKKEFGFDGHGGILSQDGGQMDSFRFTQGLLQKVREKGGRIYGQTEIKKIKTEKRGMEFITANGNKINAKRCVFANGYESFQHITPPLTTLQSTYAVISEPIPQHPVNYILWETARPYFYMRSTPDHRIIIGGRDEMFYNSHKRNALIGKKTRELIKDFNRKFPDIHFKPDFQWAGTFASTKDGLPFIGIHKKYPHAYFALGFGGNGITFSLIAAEIIHDLFHNIKNHHPALFSFER